MVKQAGIGGVRVKGDAVLLQNRKGAVAVGMKNVNVELFLEQVGIFDAGPGLVKVHLKLANMELEGTPSGEGDGFDHFFVKSHAVLVIFVGGVSLKGDMLGEVLVVYAFVTEAGADVVDFLKTTAQQAF